MKRWGLSLRKTMTVIFVFWGWVSFAPAAVTPLRETPVVRVVRGNAEAVVNIATERIIFLREAPFWGRYGSEFDVFFDQFFGFHQPAQALKLKSVGSGVIIDKEGLIVTNAHVVSMASNIFVVLSDATTVEGRLMYEDPSQELAIIKIEPPKPLKAVAMGSTQDLMVGETAVAIGNPLGLENSVTAGIISGKNRKFYSPLGGFASEDLIQIDAPINPGNSGGALLNLDGELIGINVAVVLNSQGIGFAIPVERVKEALEAYRRNKDLTVRRKAGKKEEARPDEGPLFLEKGAEEEAWDPFSEMEHLREAMDRLFRDATDEGARRGSSGIFRGELFYEPHVDIREESAGYVVSVDIRGLNKDKLNVDVGERSITVSGERSEEQQERAAGRYHASRRLGAFLKTVPLPDSADVRGVKTEVKGDTLLIRVPKKKR